MLGPTYVKVIGFIFKNRRNSGRRKQKTVDEGFSD